MTEHEKALIEGVQRRLNLSKQLIRDGRLKDAKNVLFATFDLLGMVDALIDGSVRGDLRITRVEFGEYPEHTIEFLPL